MLVFIVFNCLELVSFKFARLDGYDSNNYSLLWSKYLVCVEVFRNSHTYLPNCLIINAFILSESEYFRSVHGFTLCLVFCSSAYGIWKLLIIDNHKLVPTTA
jgi:hypothetical protein